jgi:nicotinamidase-related amidase
LSTLELKARYCKINAEARVPAELVSVEEEDISLDPKETAFLLVDTYVKDDDFIAVTKEFIKPALESAREARLHIVHVSNSCPRIALARSEFQKKVKQSLDNDMEFYFNESNVDPREYVHGNSDHLTIPDAVKPRRDEYFIRKHTYSGFYHSRLEDLLHNLGVRNLVCVGYVTGVCLLATLLDGLYRNFKIVLLRECTLGAERALEDSDDVLFANSTQKAIRYIECFVGVTVGLQEFDSACRKMKSS